MMLIECSRAEDFLGNLLMKLTDELAGKPKPLIYKILRENIAIHSVENQYSESSRELSDRFPEHLEHARRAARLKIGDSLKLPIFKSTLLDGLVHRECTMLVMIEAELFQTVKS